MESSFSQSVELIADNTHTDTDTEVTHFPIQAVVIREESTPQIRGCQQTREEKDNKLTNMVTIMVRSITTHLKY